MENIVPLIHCIHLNTVFISYFIDYMLHHIVHFQINLTLLVIRFQNKTLIQINRKIRYIIRAILELFTISLSLPPPKHF